MAHPLIRSLVWLTSFSGLGYMLYVTCTPTNTDIAKLRQSLPGLEKDKLEVSNKRQQYFEVLRAAAEEKPIYLRTKKDLDANKKIE